jgi:ribose transport system permease protein
VSESPVNTAPTTTAPPSPRARRWSPVELLSRYGLLAAWAAVIVVFSILSPDVFATSRNLQITLSTQSVLLILTLALLPALAAGEYDLSVAGVLGISYVLIGWLNVVHGWPVGAAIAVAMVAGILIGVVNALLIVGIGIDSLVATLGMGTLLAGAALGINGESVAGISTSLVDIFRTQLLGVQMGFWFAVVLTALFWYVFTQTPLGRYVFVVGAGREVARLTGLRVNAIRSGCLIAASTLAAFGGVALAALQGSADPNAGPSFLLPAFASAYLGSTAIRPGRFNAWGAFAAVYFLATGITGLQIIGLSGWIEQVFYGTSLVVAVILSHLARRRLGAAR